MKHSGESSTDPLDVPDIKHRPFQFLRQRKMLVAVGVVFGLAHSAAYVVFKQPLYENTGKFIVANPVAPVANPNPDFLPDASSIIIKVTGSSSLIDRAIEKANLKHLKSFHGTEANSAILKNLKVVRDKGEAPGATSDVIVTIFQASVAEDCKSVLDGLYGCLQDFLDQRGNGHKMTIVSAPDIGCKLTPIVPVSLTVGLFSGLLMGGIFALLADLLNDGPRSPYCLPQGENHGC